MLTATAITLPKNNRMEWFKLAMSPKITVLLEEVCSIIASDAWQI